MIEAYCVFDLENNEIAIDICNQYIIRPFKKDCLVHAKRWNKLRNRFSVRKIKITMRRTTQ
jgi:hypothetical protein